MPNWRKVITSGSDASLNSINVTNNVISGQIITSQLSLYDTVIGENGNIFLTDGNYSFRNNSGDDVFLVNSGSIRFGIAGTISTIETNNTVSRNFSLPDKNGIIALLSDISTPSGSISGSFTGSLYGTASNAINSDTASYAPLYVLTSSTSSMLQPYVLTSQTSSMSVLNSSFAISSSQAQNAISASYIPASGVVGLNLSQISTGSISASLSLNSSSLFNVSSASVSLLNINNNGLLSVSDGLNVSGSNIISGSLQFTGSLNATGSQTFVGSTVSTGTTVLSGSNSLQGINTVTGSLIASGSTQMTGSLGVNGDTTISNSITGIPLLDFVSSGSSNYARITKAIVDNELSISNIVIGQGGAGNSIVNPKISIPTSGLNISGGNFSFSLWIKRTATGVNSPYNDGIIGFGYNTSTGPTSVGQVGLFYGTTGNIGIRLGGGAAEVTTTAQNVWTHIVGTFNSATNTFTFYFNGATFGLVVNSGVVSGGISPQSNIYIGGYNMYDRALYANVHQLCFWNGILTTTEVDAIYNNGSGVFNIPSTSATLVRTYQLNDASGTSLQNSVAGNANPGTLNSGGWGGNGTGKVPVESGLNLVTPVKISNGILTNEKYILKLGDIAGGAKISGQTISMTTLPNYYQLLQNPSGSIFKNNNSGLTLPINIVDIAGGVAIGSYAGVNTTPTNGLIVSGRTLLGSSTDNATDQLQVTGTSLFTGNQRIVGNQTITGSLLVSGSIIKNGSNVNEFLRGDGSSLGINYGYHPAVYVATAAALPSCAYSNGILGVGSTLIAAANGALAVDGISTTTNMSVLVKNQVNASENGVYVVTATGSAGAPFILTRRTTEDEFSKMNFGFLIYVQFGTSATYTYSFNNNTWIGFNPTNAPTYNITFSQYIGAPGSFSGDVILQPTKRLGFNGGTSGQYITFNGSSTEHRNDRVYFVRPGAVGGYMMDIWDAAYHGNGALINIRDASRSYFSINSTTLEIGSSVGSNNLYGINTITGSLRIIGPTVITGSLAVSGSETLVGNKTITGSLNIVSGSLSLPYTIKTSTYTITNTDYTVECSGSFTVTLPTAVNALGRIYNVLNVSSGTITLAASGSETIGNTDSPPNTVNIPAGSSITTQSNNTRWRII